MSKTLRSLASVGAFVVGLLVVLQSRINGALGELLDDGLLAAWISFSVGLVIAVVIVLAIPRQRATLATLKQSLRPSAGGKPVLKHWHLLGGIGGATLVAAQGLTVQYLGVAIFTVGIVAGQNASSLVVDRVGLGPAGVQRATPRRIIAAIIATVGVAIAVASQSTGGSLQVMALILVLTAGAMVAVQQAINARVREAARSPWTAALVNFVVGWVALTLAVGLFHVLSQGGFDGPPAPWNQPVLWLGGIIGVTFIVVAAVAVPVLGVLLFGLLSIAGQITGALVVDLLFPTPGTAFSWTLVVGVLITGSAVVLAALKRPTSSRNMLAS